MQGLSQAAQMNLIPTNFRKAKRTTIFSYHKTKQEKNLQYWGKTRSAFLKNRFGGKGLFFYSPPYCADTQDRIQVNAVKIILVFKHLQGHQAF